MNIAELFIRRPIATTLIMIAILVFGLIAYRVLPVSDLPNVDFPTILVNASLPGASPETMATAVATPLESQFATIAGLDSMTSTNSLGNTQITLQFNLSRSLDAAAQDVQAAISKAERQLPQDMPSSPSYNKVNPADQPILFLALVSPTAPLSTINDYAEVLLSQRISMISGVAQVQVYGAQKYAVRAQLNPQALASMGIGIDEASTAVQSGNVNLPTGTLWGKNRAFTVQTEGQLTTAEAYKPLIVTYRNGAPVRLSQIGNVINDVENNKTASWFNKRRGIIIAILRQPGTNTVEIVDLIKKALPNLEAQMPKSISVYTLYDRSVSIRNSVEDVKYTLFLALCLVVLVIFLFLRNLSATTIPSLSLPMSLIGTFVAMYMLDYSVDNLSLMALTLSVGFVVDDAIVMLENIVRHTEQGEGILEAALNGSREISFTILSMTLSLVAVFIPVLFMGGIMGRLLHEFAVTISMAVLISGFVSLSLTPMLCSRFLKHREKAHHGRVYETSERFFNGMVNYYERSLKTALDYKKTVFIISIIILILTIYLFAVIPKGFLPNEDLGMIFGFTEGPEGNSFDSMAAHQQQIASIVSKDPNVKHF